RSRQSKWANAISDYNVAVRLEPDRAQLYRDRGLAHQNLKQFEKAWTDFSAAIRLAPRDAQTYLDRARLSLARDSIGSSCASLAICDLRKGCDLTHWQSAEYIEQLAAAYAAHGNAYCSRQLAAKAAALNAERHTPSSPRHPVK